MSSSFICLQFASFCQSDLVLNGLQATDKEFTCFENGIQLTAVDLNLEYKKSLEMLDDERLKMMMEQGRKSRRKAPKPGCYPQGFSSYRMTKNQCSLSLHDIRDDMSALASIISAKYTSVYFEEVTATGTGMLVPSENTKEKISQHPQPQIGVGRCVRRKAACVEMLQPRTAAEERRQLLAVLQRSVQEQSQKEPNAPWSCQQNRLEKIDRDMSVKHITISG
jgi:hypothetical protein